MTFGYRYLQLPHQIMPLLMICILHQSTYSSKFYSLFSAVKYPAHNVVFMYHEQNFTSAVHVKSTASISYQAHMCTWKMYHAKDYLLNSYVLMMQ